MASFFNHYFKNIKTTGAFAPSSTKLVNTMTDLDLSSSKCVVELGSGTGEVTGKIITAIPEDCTFFGLEINPTFVKTVKEKYPKAKIYLASAENIQKYLKKHGRAQCDAVISTIPWTFLPSQTQDKVFNAISKTLSADGKMITYSYLSAVVLPSSRRFRTFLKQHFSKVKTKIVWKNFPPAIVYECKK
ncbi:methyltransferase domain-containing protein [Candidatus Woesearchaeota archaeon]|nr:methyltransferase domain-containing protein [Candidatus Woesearchaeota archaeon]